MWILFYKLYFLRFIRVVMKGEITLTKVKPRQCIGDIVHLIWACPPKFNCSSAYQDGGCCFRTYGSWVFYAGFDVFDQKWRKKCVKIEYPQLFSPSFYRCHIALLNNTHGVFIGHFYRDISTRLEEFEHIWQHRQVKKSRDFFKAWRHFKKKLDGERLREIGSLQPI